MAFEQQAEYHTGGGDLLAALYAAEGGGYTAKRPQYDTQINAALADFSGQFKNLVGRDPTVEERGAYLGNLVGSSGLDAFRNNRGLELNALTSQYIGYQYADEANRIAQEQLVGQQGEANRLADLFQTQGNTAINNTEGALLDYQNRLFERLRPNLITSLQAQGLLNTGALNTSIAGAQGDLAAAGSEEMRNLRLQNEQQANAIRFAGQSAPYEFQQQQILNRPGMLQQQANTGLANAYNTFTNQLNFQNQQALMRLQQQLQPRQSGGFFKNLGSALAPSFGTSLGGSLGKWFSPSTAASASGVPV